MIFIKYLFEFDFEIEIENQRFHTKFLKKK